MPVHTSPAPSGPADAAPAVLAFWFDELGPDRWFAKDAAVDAAIARRFGALRDTVVRSRAEGWRDTPAHLTAAILVIDQFSRNMFRGSAEAFRADPIALELCYLALGKGWTDTAPTPWRQFLLMPLMHSESLVDQQRARHEFLKLGDANVKRFAALHRDQIERFGRFPGRNAALGRRTTSEEQAALDAGAAF